MEKTSGGETVDAAAALEWVYGRTRNSMLISRAFAVSSGESGPTQSTWVHRSLPSSSNLDARGRYCSEWPAGALYQPWQPSAGR